MEIQEIKFGTQLNFIHSIIKPFDFSAEKQNVVLKNFEHELQEIGTNRIILLGAMGELPISTVQLVLINADNDPELANNHDIAHVHNLWVRKDYQRRGLAEKMMCYCETVAIKRGIKTLTLGVDDYNTAAISLYQKIGYTIFRTEEGRTPEEKLFLMRKTLS